jgi:hypothetical protein
MAEDDTWRPIEVVGGDGVRDAAGRIELATTTEKHPCYLCRSFLKDDTRLREYLLANKLRPMPDGTFETPIAQDIPGRKSLTIDPKSWGYCNRNTIAVDMLATCPDWEQVRTASEMASRIR